MAARATSVSISSLFFTSLKSPTNTLLRFSFVVTPPLCYRSRAAHTKSMAHSLTRANLGLTQPADVDAPKISFAAKDIDVVEWKGDILAVGVTEKDMAKDESTKFENSLLKKLDTHLGGLLSEASSEEDFTGKAGQSMVLRLPGLGSKRVGLVGLGQSASTPLAFRNFGETIAATAKAAQANSVAIVLASPESISNGSKLNTASAIASGAVLGTYEDTRYKSESKKPVLKSVDILGLGTGPELEKKLKYAESVSSAIILGKELVNSPANVLTPGYDQFGISRKGSEDTSDEHCTIFYDKEKVELVEGGTFWLSDSPSVPGSISWGAAVPCIATWSTFQLKGVEPPGFSFQIVNTNMDELSPRSRRRSALLTWQHIASLPPSLPVVYCGGFNTQKESTTGRFLLGRSREHGVVGDMRDVWPNARARKNSSLIRTYHGFKGNKQGALEFFKLILRALCLCWDRQTQDLHVDWILFRGRSLIPSLCEVVNDNIDGYYPSSHYPIFVEFTLPRSVRLLEPPPTQDDN